MKHFSVHIYIRVAAHVHIENLCLSLTKSNASNFLPSFHFSVTGPKIRIQPQHQYR